MSTTAEAAHSPGLQMPVSPSSGAAPKWQITPLGTIPPQVIAILLGSLPVVTNSHATDQSPPQDLDTTEDLLDVDDNDDDTEEEGQTASSIQDDEDKEDQGSKHQQHQHQQETSEHATSLVKDIPKRQQRRPSSSIAPGIKASGTSSVDGGPSMHSWNSHGDDWSWSDEEPATVPSASASTTSKRDRSTVQSMPPPPRMPLDSHIMSGSGNTISGASNNNAGTKPTARAAARMSLLSPKSDRSRGVSYARSESRATDTSSNGGSMSNEEMSPARSTHLRHPFSRLRDHTQPQQQQTQQLQQPQQPHNHHLHHHHQVSVAQDLRISICETGRYIVCANKTMFAVLQRDPSAILKQQQRYQQQQEMRRKNGVTSPTLVRPGSQNSSRSSLPTLPLIIDEEYGWVLVGQSSGKDGQGGGSLPGPVPGDTITAILTLPLFMPKHASKSQVYVVVGYHSGVIRIFNELGHLLVVQLLHRTPVVSIKGRLGSGKIPGQDDDELTILFEGGKMVSIEGESLWIALRLSSANHGQHQHHHHQQQNSVDNPHHSAAPSLVYKKWHLAEQEHYLVDAISCGPARHRPSLSNGFSSASSSSMYTSQATERFLSVGSKPMVAFYASTNSGRSLLSASTIASQVASRVTNAVFGLAKSIWGSSSASSPSSPAPASPGSRPESPSFGGLFSSRGFSRRGSGAGLQYGGNNSNNSNTPGGSDPLIEALYQTPIATATEVPSVLSLNDPQRCIRHISVAPPGPRGTGRQYPSRLAAMTDSLGRVLLVDLEECEILRMWKGLRGARCGWVQREKVVRIQRKQVVPLDEHELQEQQHGNKKATTLPSTTTKIITVTQLERQLVLYLVIYAPKRGTVEIYPMGHGQRVAALQIGFGYKILTTFPRSLGKPHVLFPAAAAAAAIGSQGQGATSTATSGSVTLGRSSTEQQSEELAQCLMVGPLGEVKQIRFGHS